MAKYNFELKKKIVLEHLSLGVGSKALAKKYNVNWGRTIKNLSRKIILVTKLYQKYLVCDFEHKLLYF